MTTIGILSAATVFSMACVSLIGSMKSEVKINVKYSLTIAIGSILGGVLGKWLFNYIVQLAPILDLVTVIQAGMIALLMVIILFFVNKKGMFTLRLTNKLFILLTGFILGLIASFLGIGGGPFNVAILMLCFSMNAKESALNSIFIIFFSQLFSLIYTAFSTGFERFDLSLLPYMVLGGTLGGLLGSFLSQKVKDRHVSIIFNIGIVSIIVINLYNIVHYLT